MKTKKKIADLRIRIDPESVTGKELHVQGLTERHVVELADYLKILEIGAKHRTVAETNMNEVSSRSHAVFTLMIEQLVWRESDQTLKTRTRSKIHFIDLAGSERVDATGATGTRLKEGCMINQSLLSLGIVISALSKKSEAGPKAKQSTHIPYRDSKLTYLLSDSLGGNSLTVMIACITPSGSCYEESVSTLRFAERAKKVTNRPRVNLDPTSLRITELEAEVHRLKMLLAQCTCQNQKKSLLALFKSSTFPLTALWTERKTSFWRFCLPAGANETVIETVSASESTLVTHPHGVKKKTAHQKGVKSHPVVHHKDHASHGHSLIKKRNRFKLPRLTQPSPQVTPMQSGSQAA